MAEMARKPSTRHLFERLLRIAADKGDVEQVEERLSWGIDPDCSTRKLARTPLIRNCIGYCPMAGVVQALLKAGADPHIADAKGLTALDYVRRRLLKYEGKPRKALRRSPSLTAGGELRLAQDEWDFVEELEAEHEGAGDQYLRERRKAAEKVFDTRGELEKILPVLETAVSRRRGR
jgi:hypothetical protein